MTSNADAGSRNEQREGSGEGAQDEDEDGRDEEEEHDRMRRKGDVGEALERELPPLPDEGRLRGRRQGREWTM